MATVKTPDTKAASPGGPADVTAELLQELGLTDAENTRAAKELGRLPNELETRILGALWSEREAQKTARAHTRRLSTGGAHVLRAAAQGAGAVDLGGGLAAVVAVVSTSDTDAGRGAVQTADEALRQVLATGARPLGLLDAVRLGETDAPATAKALRAIAADLGAYVRSADTRVVGGDLRFDARQGEAALVQSCAVGVVRAETLVPARATGLGNTLVLVEGMDTDPEQAAAGERDHRAAKLVDSCLAAYRTGSVEGAVAVGPSGIAAAAVRLAQAGETGVELDLEALALGGGHGRPAAALFGNGYGQVLLVVRKGREDAVVPQLNERGVRARAVGRVTNTGRVVCKVASVGDGKQQAIAELPVALLTQQAPSYERPISAASVDTRAPEITLGRKEDAESELVRVLGSCNVGSREWLLKRLEGSSRAQAGSPGDATVLTVPAQDDDPTATRTLAVSVDASHRLMELDPRLGAAMSVAECARNLVCVGAEPIGVAHGLAFGAADAPSTAHQLSEAIEGLNDACIALKLPMVAGQVLLSSTNALATPTVAVVGQLRDPADRLGMGFGRQADMVALLGATGTGNFAGSELAVSRSGEVRGQPGPIDLAAEVKLQRAVLDLARDRLLSSAHDVSDGGVGVALAECCIAGRIGCSVELPAGQEPLSALFHEEPSRIIVSFPPEKRAKVQERCTALGVPFALLGFVGGDTLEVEEVLDVPVQVLAESHARALERIVQD
jgi:phosphoribosylformylglycinamidine (FGAM) synthase-like enzyme